MLISRLQAVLGTATLIVATAAVSIIVVSKWNFFPSMDYEDCAARAAKDAKSKDGLSVLLSICSSEFKGRRKPGGGYTYYNSCPGLRFDIGQTFDVKGPNPTPDEQQYMREQCLADMKAERGAAAEEAEADRKAREEVERKRQAMHAADYALRLEEERKRQSAKLELDKRKQNALANVSIIQTEITCYQGGRCVFDVAIINKSNESIKDISFGWMFPPSSNIPCPAQLSSKRKEYAKLRPGETTWVKNIEAYDVPRGHSSYCIKVTDVEIDASESTCNAFWGCPR
jgi:hypothetical protein